MGIKSQFNKFLLDTCPEVFEHIHISQYEYKKIAVDMSLYMHKFKAVCGPRWITAFINLIACFRRNNVHAVFIYDGKKAPLEKETERAERRKVREKLDIQVCKLEDDMETYYKTGEISETLQNLNVQQEYPKSLLH
jgi:hypothetical protein